jgi:hypothetical protein
MKLRCALVPSFASVLALIAVCASASAQQWQVFEEESVSLDYRNAADTESVFSVLCGARHSDITIPLAPGIKPPAQAPEPRVTEPTGVNAIKLRWDVCGGELTCTDRPNGDVSTYFVKTNDKQIALRFADKASSLAIDAPGIKLTAEADKKAFARFAALCRKQR